MRCRKCGREINDSATFCGFCGQPVSPAPYGGGQAAQAGNGAGAYAGGAAQGRGRGSSGGSGGRTALIIAVSVVVALLVLFAILFFLVRSGRVEPDRVPLIGSLMAPGDSERAERRTESDDETPKSKKQKEDREEETPKPETQQEAAAQAASPATETDTPASAASAATPVPTLEPTPEPTPEPAPDRTARWSNGSILVLVDDDAQIWTDTGAQPFAGVAERIAVWTNCSILVVSTDDTLGLTPENYLKDYCSRLLADEPTLVRSLQDSILILIDPSGIRNKVVLQGGAAQDADADYMLEQLRGNLKNNNYEYAICQMLTLPRAAEPADETDHYILPFSDTRLVTEEDLKSLTWEQCTLARNEIYARHGRMFNNKTIREYFESQSWYSGTIPAAVFDAEVNKRMTQLEITNVYTISNYEKKTYGGSKY